MNWMCKNDVFHSSFCGIMTQGMAGSGSNKRSRYSGIKMERARLLKNHG